MGKTYRTTFRVAATFAIAAATLVVNIGTANASAGTISGVAYQDLDRDGARGSDEPAFADHRLYLYNGSGTYVGNATTDGSGRYEFAGLSDGTYSVKYASPSWWPIREQWVPSGTGSLFPERAVSLTGSAIADFPWRPIVRSTTLSAPISSFTGPNGLRVSSYNDVVTAREVYDAVMRGSVGGEAPTITIRFGYSSGSTTTSGAVHDGSRYVSYSAMMYVSYVSWLDVGDTSLSHEYGHAWSMHHAFLAQQDPSLGSYLSARGLAGDPRIGSSYAWSPAELIAEDYRQLFGSPTARIAPQTNRDVPAAADVPGLSEFLSTTFIEGAQTEPDPEPEAPPISIDQLTATQLKSGTKLTFSLSAGASVTVRILRADGSTVATLMSDRALAAGPAEVKWDRKDSAGRRARAGSYTARVDATDPGSSDSESVSFQLS